MDDFKSIELYEIVLENSLKNNQDESNKNIKKISVELYKELDCYFVEYINDLDPEKNKTLAFGRLTQAKTIFKDKVKLAKYEKKKYDEIIKSTKKDKISNVKRKIF